MRLAGQCLHDCGFLMQRAALVAVVAIKLS
jgi:hypothetical protein